MAEHLAEDRQRRVGPAGRAGLQDRRDAFCFGGLDIGAGILPAEADEAGDGEAFRLGGLKHLASVASVT